MKHNDRWKFSLVIILVFAERASCGNFIEELFISVNKIQYEIQVQNQKVGKLQNDLEVLRADMNEHQTSLTENMKNADEKVG